MIDVVLQRSVFDDLVVAVGTTDTDATTPVALSLEPETATAVHNALIVARHALVPQPSELAGQAVAQMGREADHGALKRLRELVNEHLRALGME